MAGELGPSPFLLFLLIWPFRAPVVATVFCETSTPEDICMVTAADDKPHVAKLQEGATVPFQGRAPWSFSSKRRPIKIEIDGRVVAVTYGKPMKVRR